MLEIKVYGVKELQKKLKSFKPQHLKEVLKTLGAVVQSQTIERFEDQVDPAGQKWKALKNPKSNKLILNDTGQLKRIAYNLKGDSVKIGPTVNYGVYHQFGTKKMASRPFLGINQDDYNEIEEVLTQQLRRHYGG